MRRYLFPLLMLCCLIAALLLITTACSGESKNLPTDNQSASESVAEAVTAPATSGEQQPSATSPAQDSTTPGGGKQVLRVSQCYNFYNLEYAIEKFKVTHPDVEIVLTKYNSDIEKYRQQVVTQLMTGIADDILDSTEITENVSSGKGLLTDIYPLMQNDPDFHEADYFMNVLDALATDGKLLTFPAFFSYRLVGVQTKHSQALTEQFKQFDAITYRELLDLYRHIDAKEGKYLCENIDAVNVILANINDFVDFENKTCNFITDDFIKLISDAKQATSPRRVAEDNLGFLVGKGMTKSTQEEYARQYIFDHADERDFLVFFPYAEEQLFTHYIPLTSETGKLLIAPIKRLSISESSANKVLAWEFIKFLTTEEANPDLDLYSFPIQRELYQSYVTGYVERHLDFWRNEEGYDIIGDAGEVAAQALASQVQMNEMPMEVFESWLSMSFYEVLRETMKSFYQGLMTAEQVASELQNKMSLALMEMQ